jgi:hypothetical protein
MSVKLIMHWDIKQDQDQDYFEFVVREFVPAITRLGLRPTGAWYSLYSRKLDEPRMMSEAEADNLETMRGILTSPEWGRLHEQLLEYVENYSRKVVYTSGDFQF